MTSKTNSEIRFSRFTPDGEQDIFLIQDDGEERRVGEITRHTIECSGGVAWFYGVSLWDSEWNETHYAEFRSFCRTARKAHTAAKGYARRVVMSSLGGQA